MTRRGGAPSRILAHDEHNYSAVWWGAALCVMGWGAAYFLSDLRESDATQRFSQMEEAEEKAEQVAHDSLTKDISLWGSTAATTSAFAALSEGFDAYIPEHLRDTYVLLNPFPGSERAMFEDARDGSAYTQAHATHHSWFRQIVEERGYEDLYLLNREGEVIYSTQKRTEFATKLGSGESDASGLALVFREVISRRRAGQVAMSGQGSSVSLPGVSAKYAGTGIFDGEGQLSGVLAIQQPATAYSTLASKRASAFAEISAERNQAFGIIFALSFIISAFSAVWSHAARAHSQSLVRYYRPGVQPSLSGDGPRSEPYLEGHQSGTRLVISASRAEKDSGQAQTG